MKRLLVVGAGAIGGFLAGRLAQAGAEVHAVARGAQLAALAGDGLTLRGTDGRVERIRFAVHRDIAAAAAAAGAAFDAVFVCLKAHQVLPVLPALVEVAREAGLLVPVHNGVGWWYFQRAGGRFDGEPVRAVDPDGAMVRQLPVDRTVPMFAFKSNQVTAPGEITCQIATSDAFPLGELDGADTARLRALIALLDAAALAPARVDVRATMWAKLLGNVYANPISALTESPIGPLATFPDTRALALALMAECAAVASALGVTIPATFEARLARAVEVGDARPSMLQDRDAGRAMEIEPILGALVELGGKTGVATPHVFALLACLRLIQAREQRAPAARSVHLTTES